MGPYNIITGSDYLELTNNVNLFLEDYSEYFPIGNPQQQPYTWLQVMYSGSRNGNQYQGG